jgi:hypothetical protein
MTATLQSWVFSKGGSRTASRPEFSVEVVVASRRCSSAAAVWLKKIDKAKIRWLEYAFHSYLKTPDSLSYHEHVSSGRTDFSAGPRRLDGNRRV